jgi:isoquinoline 1-oxidoreductase subunit beta
LAQDAAKVAVPNPASLKRKHQKDWIKHRQAVQRVELPSKANGTAIFGIDVRLLGMKQLAIAMSPVFGGKLKSYDAGVALSRPGGDNAGVDDAIAVVADDW